MKLWAYNSHTGAVTKFVTILDLNASLHSGTGWHGPFATQQDAVNYYQSNKTKNPGWAPPTDSVSGRLDNAGKSIQRDILGGVDLGAWFLRVGEILLGLVLLGVGVAKLTGTTNVIASAVKARV